MTVDNKHVNQYMCYIYVMHVVYRLHIIPWLYVRIGGRGVHMLILVSRDVLHTRLLHMCIYICTTIRVGGGGGVMKTMITGSQ